MKKLLSVSFCIAMLCTMLVGLTGCPKKDDKAAVDTKKGLAAPKEETVKMKVGDKKDVKVTYTVGSEVKVKTIAAASDKETVAKATVSPTEMKATGDATVAIEAIAEGTAVITVTATGDGSTPGSTTTKITVTVEKK